MKKMSFESKYFTAYKLTNDIYALIDANEKDSNAGILNLGDDIIIFDTFLDIDAAKDMKKLCLELYGKEPTYIVNSHSHSDHIMGNCVFESKIISSKLVKDEIALFKSQINAQKEDIKNELKQLREKLPTLSDETDIKNLKNQLHYYSNFIKEGVSIKVPNITFNSELTLHDKLKLKSFDIAHSKGDVIGFLENEKICFTGDLLFTKNHPWLGNGEPENTINILESLLEYDIDYFVPGHGPIATKQDVEEQITYIKEVIALVKSKLDEEEPKFDKSELSDIFTEWNDLTFKWNVKSLFKKYKKS